MARSTRTFKSEVDAKLFAMQILSKGWTASAGTLNPHQPKQIVGPAQIETLGRSGTGWVDHDFASPEAQVTSAARVDTSELALGRIASSDAIRMGKLSHRAV